MTDLSVFAEAGFDAKAWINAACAGRPQEEPLERFLAELEMRLQVSSSVASPSMRSSGGLDVTAVTAISLFTGR